MAVDGPQFFCAHVGGRADLWTAVCRHIVLVKFHPVTFCALVIVFAGQFFLWRCYELRCALRRSECYACVTLGGWSECAECGVEDAGALGWLALGWLGGREGVFLGCWGPRSGVVARTVIEEGTIWCVLRIGVFLVGFVELIVSSIIVY
ncbi:hypothetical protein Tco_0704197 [Tanacetum coccineum]|uniref:Uncharacterized protein n=1 Tax=Tanacetum coccineum TaxID=301880 RepID=A0ABQ4Y2I3_9ASTR